MKQITFSISDEAAQLLKDIAEKGQAEYRDTNYETKEDFLNDASNTGQSLESFLRRNFGGTYYLIGELLKHNLIDTHEMAWHPTYVLTELGKEALEQIK